MCPQIVLKLPIIKFHENNFGNSHVSPRGQTDPEELTVAMLRISGANAPKMYNPETDFAIQTMRQMNTVRVILILK